MPCSVDGSRGSGCPHFVSCSVLTAVLFLLALLASGFIGCIIDMKRPAARGVPSTLALRTMKRPAAVNSAPSGPAICIEAGCLRVAYLKQCSNGRCRPCHNVLARGVSLVCNVPGCTRTVQLNGKCRRCCYGLPSKCTVTHCRRSAHSGGLCKPCRQGESGSKANVTAAPALRVSSKQSLVTEPIPGPATRSPACSQANSRCEVPIPPSTLICRTPACGTPMLTNGLRRQELYCFDCRRVRKDVCSRSNKKELGSTRLRNCSYKCRVLLCEAPASSQNGFCFDCFASDPESAAAHGHPVPPTN